MAAKRKANKDMSIEFGVVDSKPLDTTETEATVAMVTDKNVWYVCYGFSFIAEKSRFSPKVKTGDKVTVTHSGTIGLPDYRVISIK